MQEKKITPFSGPNFRENAQRAGKHQPCCICGKAIKFPHASFDVGVTDGGARFFNLKDDAKEYATDSSGYMGGYLIGPDCYRILKAQQPELFT